VHKIMRCFVVHSTSCQSFF